MAPERCFTSRMFTGAHFSIRLVFPCMRLRAECGTFVCSFFTLFVRAYAGRFDDSVIEERRQCSEDLLQFSANIPALYGSQHIQEFFKVSQHFCRDTRRTQRSTIKKELYLLKGGDVHDGSELIGPAESFSDFLADSLSDCSSDG